jgi:hypothetical protein
MQKSGFFYRQTEGRREGDTEKKYVLDWWKIIAAASLSAVLGWATWVTVCTFSSIDAEEKIDLQTNVLHGRVSALGLAQENDETRLEERIYELQRRFYEDLIEDCTEQLEDCNQEISNDQTLQN